jgi:HEAT repeat protein
LARALGHAPSARAKEIVQALIQAFQSNNEKDLRLAVLTSLGQMHEDSKSLLPVLTEALKSGTPELVQAACQAAAKIGPDAQKLLPDLAASLGVPDSAVRKEALAAMRKVGPTKETVSAVAGVLQEKDADVVQEALGVLEVLGKESRPAVPALVRLLGDQKDLHKKIVAVLSKVGKEAVNPLIKALDDDSAALRLGAAKALGEMGQVAKPAAQRLFLQAQADPDAGVRDEAMKAAGKLSR